MLTPNKAGKTGSAWKETLQMDSTLCPAVAAGAFGTLKMELFRGLSPRKINTMMSLEFDRLDPCPAVYGESTCPLATWES